jgi:hypothetical protein
MSGTFQGRLAYASCAIVAGPAVTITSQSGDFDETPVTAIYQGSGQYQLTLSSPIDPAECCYQVTCRTASPDVRVASIISATTNDTTIEIEVLDETATNADPLGFDILVVVKPAN